MRERGYCYPNPVGRAHPSIIECGPLGIVGRVHDRPGYTLDQARQVCQWVNGNDQPLPTMIQRYADRWDPGRPSHLRGTPGRVNISIRARLE